MQFPGMGKPPLNAIFDSDMGERIDTVLALALLHGLEGKSETRLASISITKSNLKAAAFCDAMERFYLGTPVGPFSRILPVGMSTDGRLAADTPIGTVAEKHNHAVRKLNDTAEVAALIRNALTAQYDGNAVVLLAGPATNLVRAMGLPRVKELALQKARYLVISEGGFPGPDPDAARRLVAEWPTPIVTCGREIGEALRFPAESIEKDFAWSPSHPVVDAYRAFRPMPYDAPATDMAAALYAIRPKESYFQLSEPKGQQRSLVLDPAQRDRIVQVFRELASAKPVPRLPRRRPAAEQNAEKK